MDRKKLENIRTDLQEAVKNIEKKHGVKVELGSASYSRNNAKLALEIAEIGENNVVLNRAAEDFKRRATFYGLKPDDLGKTFGSVPDRYKIIGIRPRSKKAPIICEKENGRQYGFPASIVIQALKDYERSIIR